MKPRDEYNATIALLHSNYQEVGKAITQAKQAPVGDYQLNHDKTLGQFQFAIANLQKAIQQIKEATARQRRGYQAKERSRIKLQNKRDKREMASKYLGRTV